MNNRIAIQFLGAASTVTGSKHLLKTPEKTILIDCGLFQGIKSLRERNWQQLPIDVSKIDLVILTHAHLDHCGYLPILVKSGYKGKILMSPPTRDLVEIILRDSAHIQEEDAEHANKHGYSRHKPALPLYITEDVENALAHFQACTDNEWISVSENIRFRYLKNGHILGSCFIEMICFGKTIVFSGDIGRKTSELLDSPTVIESADFLIMESTYGDRIHKETPIKEELADIIHATIRHQGCLLIPSFAVGRAQELMHIIHRMKVDIQIPDVPVFMDSPMAAEAMKVLQKYPAWHKLGPKECEEITNSVTTVTDRAVTNKVIKQPGSKVVIAASGMLVGGRVLAYLENYIEDKHNTILLVGYQAEGTRGRALKEGNNEIKLHGKYFRVHARVREITGLSGHADQLEMMDWLRQYKKKPGKIFIVHGEPMAQEVFSQKIKDELQIETIVPVQNQEEVLFTI